MFSQPARAAMRRALIAILALYPVAGSAAVLWFGDKGGLHQIDTSVNRVVVDVAMEPPVAVAVNAADGSAWAVTQSRVLHVNSTGAIQFQVALKDLGSGLGAPRLVAINSNDASVWAGFENRVLHFDGDGALHQSIATAAADLTVAQDGSLWILTQSSVEQRDSSGALVKSAVLSGAAKGAKRLALDDAGAALWVAGDKDLVKLSLSDPAQMLVALTAPQTTSAISLDMQSGDLWFLGQQGLYAFTRDGAPRISRDLRDFTISNPQALVFDAASQAAWVGHSQGLSRIATAGTLAASFSADAKTVAVAIGRMPLNITPIVAIVAPKDGALLNNATPQFSVTYDALCGATPCGFPGSFFKTFNLSAVINGAQLGSAFTFNSTSGGSTYTPATRLPEGQNSWTVVARDAFGHTSDSVTATFTVDTIAPQFQTVSPATNSSYTTPNVTITGTVDDTNATVSLGTQTQGPSFSFPIVLNPGDNSVTLNARDKAGTSARFRCTTSTTARRRSRSRVRSISRTSKRRRRSPSPLMRAIRMAALRASNSSSTADRQASIRRSRTPDQQRTSRSARM